MEENEHLRSNKESTGRKQVYKREAVGGHFETVSTKTLYETFKMPMIMLVDEDGIMKQKEVNRLGSYFYDADRHGWPILGDIAICNCSRRRY